MSDATTETKPAPKTKAAHYPNPGAYLALVRKADAIVAAGGTVRTFWGNPDLDADGWFEEKIKALNGRINAKGGIEPRGRKTSYEYQSSLSRDSYRGLDYSQRRIVQSGGGMETEYGIRAYPDAQAAFTGRDF